MRRAVEMRSELHAVIVDLAERREAEHLEPAAVGQDRPGPSHEPVQPPEPCDHIVTRPEKEMIGIAEEDLDARRGQLLRGERLDGAVSADRHERGGVDVPVKGTQPAAPRAARIGRQEVEAEQGHGHLHEIPSRGGGL